MAMTDRGTTDGDGARAASPEQHTARLVLGMALSSAVGGLLIGGHTLAVLAAGSPFVDVRVDPTVFLMFAVGGGVGCALLRLAEGIALRVRPASRPATVAVVGGAVALLIALGGAVVLGGLLSGTGPAGAIEVMAFLVEEVLGDPIATFGVWLSALVPFTTVGAFRTVALPLSKDRVGRWPLWVGLFALPASGAMAVPCLLLALGWPDEPESWALISAFCIGVPPTCALGLGIASWVERRASDALARRLRRD